MVHDCGASSQPWLRDSLFRLDETLDPGRVGVNRNQSRKACDVTHRVPCAAQESASQLLHRTTGLVSVPTPS